MLEAMLQGHEKVPLLSLYVRELVSRNFWKLTAPGQYEFTHKSVQEVIYSMLTVAQRQEMHYAYVLLGEAYITCRALWHHASSVS